MFQFRLKCYSLLDWETKSRISLRYIPSSVRCLEWSDTSIVRHWPRSPLFPRFSELEDRSHRIVRPFSLSHAGYPRSRASYTRITWRGSRPRVRWPAALQGRPRAMLPNTTSDDAANAAIIVGPILWRRPACGERHVVSTGHVDNSREVIVDAQLYRLSCVSPEWRHSQQPRFDRSIGGYGNSRNSNMIFEIRGPTFYEIYVL